MENYSQYISPNRKCSPTPKSLIQNGTAVFGTFDKEFETLNLFDCKNPIGRLFPEFLKKYRLTRWEAAEVHLDQGILLSVVSNMGLFGMTFHVFYDKRNKKTYSWCTNLSSSKTEIAPNLLNGSVSKARTKYSSIKYINDFQDGRCSFLGSHYDKMNKIEYKFDLERVSLPSVVSIPFGPNRPLYTQKDFFKANGYLVLNDEIFESNDHTTAIIDDHRGYYPYHSHYDWLTTMGRNVNGKECYFAFNLTHNQSIDPEKYNENLIWFKGKTSILPPIKFVHHAKDTAWMIRDEHDMVDITFTIGDMYRMEKHAGVIDINYHVAFGEITGYVRDTDGTKYILDGMLGMGEDVSLRR